MTVPGTYTIGVVGRPNVGKSSLFNALLGYRRAIVLDMPGTTRDEVTERVRWADGRLRIVDSQGIFDEGDEGALASIIRRSDALLLVVDAIAGPTPFDIWIAKVVTMAKKPVLLCVNKSEGGRALPPEDFAGLGFPEMVAISAAHRRGLDEIKQWCLTTAGIATVNTDDDEAGEEAGEAEASGPLSIALIGRPNAGKSTLMNRLAGDRVSRVSPEPLTTRDPVSYELDTARGAVRLIDTAGMRRPRSRKEQLEIFSINASTRAIREADVVLLLIASFEPLTDQDMRLLNLVEREGKPTLILLNFWDRLSKREQKEFVQESEFGTALKQFKTVPVSGLTGFGVDRLIPLSFRMNAVSKSRVQTSKLNRFVQTLVRKNPPPSAGRHNFNILYASQVRSEPPTFVFFMNRKGSLPVSYQKYVENSLRKHLGLHGQTIRVHFRGSE